MDLARLSFIDGANEAAYANILPGNEARGDSVASVSNWQVKSHLPIGFVGRTVKGPIKTRIVTPDAHPPFGLTGESLNSSD
jgi:hypothetical protein